MRYRPVASLVMMIAGASAATASAAAQGASAPTAPLPRARPESVGMSAARLQYMTQFFKIESARHAAAGYVMMVARDGKLIHESAIGYRNLEQQVPMTLDTRFRLQSMTKPITAVAVLMLYEEGRFHLDDPVARFLPEFAHPRVFTGVDAKGKLTTEPAQRDITIRDLLTNTSGLGYVAAVDGTTPLGKAYASLTLGPHASLADNVRRIAGMPLFFQPGTAWRYSYSYDVLGRLVEVVAGMPFAQFLSQRLFVPLQMHATGFYLQDGDEALLATPYRHDGAGGLQAVHARRVDDPSDTRRWPSGGGGLISTAGDYLRFAQMLANGGSLDGHQYLSPVTVALMTENHVPKDAEEQFWGSDSVGLGYGLGVGVEIDTRHAPQAGFLGDYEWGGYFDTHWLVSPRTGIVAVMLAQVVPTANHEAQRTDVDFRDLLFASVSSLTPQRAAAGH